MPLLRQLTGHNSTQQLRRNKSRTLAVLGIALCLASSTRADLATEYQVKAGVLYNFAKFVTWPPETFRDEHQLFNICTSGGRLWDRVLEEMLKDKTVGERAVISRSVHSEKDVKGCQVLFIPGSEESKRESYLLEVKFPGVLTVTESTQEGKHGGNGAVITFVLDRNRVRFVINTKAAEKTGLVISSKLLSLALEVHQ